MSHAPSTIGQSWAPARGPAPAAQWSQLPTSYQHSFDLVTVLEIDRSAISDNAAIDLRRLSRVLYDLDVPPSRYRLDGSHFELAHVLDRRDDRWVVFLSERGGESGATAFDDEHAACAYLLGKVLGELAEHGSLRLATPAYNALVPRGVHTVSFVGPSGPVQARVG